MRVHDFEICRPATLEEIVAEHELELKEHNAITQRMVDAAPPMPIRVSFRSEAARRMVEQLMEDIPLAKTQSSSEDSLSVYICSFKERHDPGNWPGAPPDMVLAVIPIAARPETYRQPITSEMSPFERREARRLRVQYDMQNVELYFQK